MIKKPRYKSPSFNKQEGDYAAGINAGMKHLSKFKWDDNLEAAGRSNMSAPSHNQTKESGWQKWRNNHGK